MDPDAPARILTYENMLYPQYENKFQKVISKETWEWLQAEAHKNLEKNIDREISPTIRKHWMDIVDGKVPFGYTVTEER